MFGLYGVIFMIIMSFENVEALDDDERKVEVQRVTFNIRYI